MSLDQLHQAIYRRVENLDKTNFTLALMTANPAEWIGPRYIAEGLTPARTGVLDHEAPEAVTPATFLID